MSLAIARAAREFEVLMARAAERGRLEPGELLDAYAQLQPGGHLLAADPRRLDLAAIVASLQAMPEVLLSAPAIHLVPRLEAFAHERLLAGPLPAGRLPDGTVIVEAAFGMLSLMHFAAPLCALAHETRKAHRLLQSEGAADAMAGAEPTADARVEYDLARVALMLGLEEAGLARIPEPGRSALLRLWRGDAAMPPVRIHAELAPAAVAGRAHDLAQQILAHLAEMGLADRPLHLWLGSGVVTDCLSPYARDLRPALTTWAGAHPDLVGDDVLPWTEPPGEDAIYAVMHDFLRSEPALVGERAAADRTVGVLRAEANGLPFELVDLGRVDQRLCDARLAGWSVDSPAPVLVRVLSAFEDEDGVALRTLLATVGMQLRSITVALDGTTFNGREGTVVLPHLLVRWAGEEKTFIPGVAEPSAMEFLGHAEAPVLGGAVLSVPTVSLLCPTRAVELTRAYGVVGVVVGGTGILGAIADARYGNAVPASASVCWAVIHSRPASTGRPRVPTLRAHSILAVARLRSLLQGGRESTRGPHKSNKRTVQLKA